MEILTDREKIYDIVEKHAKYQKVMCIYGKNVSNLELQNLQNEIQKECIYNCKSIFNLDDDIYSYKMLIFLCTADEYKSLVFDVNEFINVFIPTSKDYLIYFLNSENKLSLRNDYILLENNFVDLNALSSIEFNKSLRTIDSLIFSNGDSFVNSYKDKIITQNNTIRELQDLVDYNFLDIDIIKTQNMDFDFLPLVNIAITDAIIVFLDMIEQNNFEMVDIYKTERDNIELIDKVYKNIKDKEFFLKLKLNLKILKKSLNETKFRLLNFLSNKTYSCREIEIVLNKLKEYCKNSQGFLNYLYIYNIL